MSSPLNKTSEQIKDRSREQSREPSRNRERSRGRSRDRSSDRSRDRSRNRDRDRKRRVRHHSWDRTRRSRDRSRSWSYDKNRREHSRERYRGREAPKKNSRFPETDNEFSTKGQGPPRIEGMVSLKVDNITHRTTVSQLKRLFSRYGDLGDIYVPRYPDSYMTRGFAFVRYFRKRDAEEAMRKLDGERLDGRVLSIQMAKYARPSSSSSSSRRKRDDRRRTGRPNDRRRQSRSRSKSRSRSHSRSRKRLSRSRSQSSRSRSLSRSRSKSRSKSSNRSEEHADDRSKSRSKSRDRSRSPSRSRSESRSSRDEKVSPVNRNHTEDCHSARSSADRSANNDSTEIQENIKDTFIASDDEKDHSDSSEASSSIRTNGKRHKNDTCEDDALAESNI